MVPPSAILNEAANGVAAPQFTHFPTPIELAPSPSEVINMTCGGLKMSGKFLVFMLALWLAVCSQAGPTLAQSDKA